MLFGKYIAGLVILSVLPLLFLLARFCAKHSRRLPWTIDDTFLVLALLLLYVVVAMFTRWLLVLPVST
ncbi:hypothetical protein ACET3X_008793 [Alternaria dauci]|uniref:DUF1656 domain-containing protein n=1 Tax=Alternaria dauci TaxID=48095 RepID=A0ABR3U765_9PLEO